MKGVWRALWGVWLLLRGMGTLYYSSLCHPFKTTLIDRNTSKIIGHFNSKELAEFQGKYACPTCGRFSEKTIKV